MLPEAARTGHRSVLPQHELQAVAQVESRLQGFGTHGAGTQRPGVVQVVQPYVAG